MENDNSRTSITMGWLSTFYITDDDRIDIDWSVSPPFAMLYRDLFFIMNTDGTVKVAYKPDAIRISLVMLAIVLHAFEEQVDFGINEDGILEIKESSIPLSIELPDQSGRKVRLMVRDMFMGELSSRTYSTHYRSLYHELTNIYHTLEKYLCHLTN